MQPCPTPENLEDWLSKPTDAVRHTLKHLPGDIVFLGAGGKMGPSLARMAQRASEQLGQSRRIYGVSRFSQPEARQQLIECGAEPIDCDLLDPKAVDQLPDASLAVFMTGMKFGGAQQAGRMWAMNTLVPAHVCRRYVRSRFLVFSTGNVYPYTDPAKGGSVESDLPHPVGEYGMSALGRERTFEYFSEREGIPVVTVRLNYACDLRYGVMVDLAGKIRDGQPIDLAMGHVNTIWQGDANALALAALSLADSPPCVLNVTGPDTLAVRDVCERLGVLMDKPVEFRGQPNPQALLNNGRRALQQFGPLQVNTDTLVEWVAHWIVQGYPTLDKPTGFENRSGRF